MAIAPTQRRCAFGFELNADGTHKIGVCPKCDPDGYAKSKAPPPAKANGVNGTHAPRTGRGAAMSHAPEPPPDLEPLWADEDERAATTTVGVTAKLTDVATAERLVALHGADLRHVGTWGKGLAWDGRRWALDEGARWQQAAVDTSRVLVKEALDEVQAATDSGREERIKAAKADLAKAIGTQNASRIGAMMTVARSTPGIIVKHADLDADRWALNVDNGTLDLRSGRLRPHRRDDLITRLTPVAYDPVATAPTWNGFVERSMGGSKELVDYLARLIGYALTGNVGEHILAFFFGGGANGKSTFLSTIHAMLGDYASPAPRGLLFRARGERHPTELASLHGRRFVTCSEIEEGQAFDEALVKDITGGDPIECRRMREDFWSYEPTHKLFLAGNHKPTVRGDDEGIWRRMRLVPWLVTIPEAERDRGLPDKLRAELPGILAWAVRGCLSWQANGLDAPQAVRDATAAYREENDVLGEFFRLSVTFDAGVSVARKALREAYVAFCDETGAEPFGAKRFAGRLRERGVTETTVRDGMKVVNGWKGVRLATDAERAAVTAWNPERRYVGTCSDEIGIRAYARAHTGTNPESLPATAYVPTDRVEQGQEDFAAYVEREGIGGGQ